MNNITLRRGYEFQLIARSFKVLIDGVQVDIIDTGETKTIALPPNGSELTVKIMGYESRPKKVSNANSYDFSIKQNKIYIITNYGMLLFASIFFISKYQANYEQMIFLYIGMAFASVQFHYSSFGRRDVIQLADTKVEKAG